jgi:uncharacterized protein
MSTEESAANLPPITELTSRQRRVLGVLVEKGFTTPEYYPLTIKAVTTGCNQKSNRSPVVSYDEDSVYDTLEQLREMGLSAIVHTETGRTERFRHYMRHRFSFSGPQLAILAELLLRGRQQMGELRSRASRMVGIDGQKELREELRVLMEGNYVQVDGSLERRGVEVDHNLYTEREASKQQPMASQPSATAIVPVDDPPVATQSVTPIPAASHREPQSEQVVTLEREVQELRGELRELRESYTTLQEDVSQLDERFEDLRRDLGG